MRVEEDLVEALSQPKKERSIGTIYLAKAEQDAHYYNARLGLQFDAVIHIDKTTAIKPFSVVKAVNLENVEPQATFGV